MSTSASEVNETTRARRGRAAKGQSAHEDIDGKAERNQARVDEAQMIAKLVIEKQAARQAILDEAKEIRMGAKALTKEIAAEYDKVENLGFDRQCFKDMLVLMQKESDARIKYEATRKQLARGFGFESGEQLDAFIEQANSELSSPPSNELQEGQADAIAAHLAKHGSTPTH